MIVVIASRLAWFRANLGGTLPTRGMEPPATNEPMPEHTPKLILFKFFAFLIILAVFAYIVAVHLLDQVRAQPPSFYERKPDIVSPPL